MKIVTETCYTINELTAEQQSAAHEKYLTDGDVFFDHEFYDWCCSFDKFLEMAEDNDWYFSESGEIVG